jgi:hypothetical protein
MHAELNHHDSNGNKVHNFPPNVKNEPAEQKNTNLTIAAEISNSIPDRRPGNSGSRVR